MWFTTKCKTKAGKVYDLGLFKFPPKHDHARNGSCDECLVINAWTERL